MHNSPYTEAYDFLVVYKNFLVLYTLSAMQVGSIQRDDVVKFLNTWLLPKGAILGVLGNVRTLTVKTEKKLTALIT